MTSTTCPYCGETPIPCGPENDDWVSIRWACGSFVALDADATQQSIGCRLATAERDAARYRFIRDNLAKRHEGDLPGTYCNSWGFGHMWQKGETFDAAIDSMMAAEPHRGEA